MAQGKKSFVLYTDLIHTVSQLPDEIAGRLFKHILDYVNDLNPETDDLILKIAFEPIKQQLKRDLQKYDSIVERNKINGSKGGRPKKQEKPKKPSGLFGNQIEPPKADNDTGSVIVSDIAIKKDIYRSFLHLQLSVEEFKKLIEAGYSKSEIDNTLDSIENYKKNKNYTSLFLTAKNWLKKDNSSPKNNQQYKNNHTKIFTETAN